MYNVSDTYRELIKAPVRYTGISGAARLRDGTIIHLTDDNIAAGSLSITQKMNGRGDFRPGGVYSGELSCSLKGFAGKTSDLDGAAIRLAFILYHDSDMQAAKSETVPLGRFYVDGSSIKRRNDTVTLSAFDGMALFDVEATERSGTLYELVCGACSAAGVSFGMTQAEFEALPNAAQTAKINTARIQTERDLLMYVGMMTASFARISRSNELEFVPLTCERNDGGVIVPVREIAGNIRFNTDFSDDTTCIAKLFTRRNGAAVYSTSEISAGGSEKLAVMELNENPLLAELSDDVVAGVLNNELLQMYKCLNRVFDSSFTGDPALEIGDYVRLRGGAIDTDRGYATGMITSQIWRYRGQHTIKCSMPSSLSAVEESAVAAYSAETSTESRQRTQPKSQTEKQIDELRKQLSQSGGTAEKLETSGTNTSAVTNDLGGITTSEGDVAALNIEASPSLKYFDISIPSLKFSIHGTESEFSMSQAGPSQTGSLEEKRRIKLSDTAGILIKSNQGSDIRIELPYAGIGIAIDKTDFAIWTSIAKLYTAAGTLYYNGKRILLEG